MEKRKYGRRIAIEAEASIQSGSTRVQARATDLGIGGMALETDPGVELERFLRIRIRLTPGAAPLDVDAIVRRRENGSEVVRWGVELVNPSPAALARIEECLDLRGAATQQSPADEEKAAARAAAAGSTPDSELHGLFESALQSLDL